MTFNITVGGHSYLSYDRLLSTKYIYIFLEDDVYQKLLKSVDFLAKWGSSGLRNIIQLVSVYILASFFATVKFFIPFYFRRCLQSARSVSVFVYV